MQRHISHLLHNRDQAGRLLSKKLLAHKSTDARVIGIPPAGALVASALAEELNLEMQLLPCRKIRHPSVQSRNIGSVSADEIVVRDGGHDLPQDYIYHQVAMLRNVIRYEQRFYYNNALPSLNGKNVILVDEYLENAECILACIGSLRKAHVKSITVAIPVLTVSASHIIGVEADNLVYLYQQNDPQAVKHCYEENENPQEQTIREMLHRTNRSHELAEH